MKKVLFASLAAIVFLGAGCVDRDEPVVQNDDTVVPDSSDTTMQDNAEETNDSSIDNASFSLSVPAGSTLEENGMMQGRYQNFMGSDSPAPLNEGEYFIEFGINITGDLEFNDDYENITEVIIDGQVVDRGELKRARYGGDGTKYNVGYFRAGDGKDREPVIFYVYADTLTGIAAGEATLKDIKWNN